MNFWATDQIFLPKYIEFIISTPPIIQMNIYQEPRIKSYIPESYNRDLKIPLGISAQDTNQNVGLLAFDKRKTHNNLMEKRGIKVVVVGY